MRAWYTAALLILTSAISLAAQQAAPPFARWDAGAAEQAGDSLQPPKGDYRYEGLAFGGLVFGALGAYIGSRDFSGGCPLQPGIGCGDEGSHLGRAIVAGLAGAAVGGGLGYLVGRFSPKKPRPDSLAGPRAQLASVPDSIRLRVGYQHWRGAAMGLAIGAGAGALLGMLAPMACSDCQPPSRGEAILTVGLLGAGAGGLVGFLAGLSSPKHVWVPRPDSIQGSSQ
jgi:hypothetical protein